MTHEVSGTAGDRAIVRRFSPLSDEQKAAVDDLKQKAASYYDAVCEVEEKFGAQRDYSVAKTKIQEASMWAVRGVTNPE